LLRRSAAPSYPSSRPAARPSGAVALRAGILALALLLAGCGGGDSGEEPAQPDATRFRAALDSLGSGVEPSGSGYGWIDVARVEETSGRGGVMALAAALGPGAGTVVRSSAEMKRRTGLDPLTAERIVSVSGSYALALRLDGVDPGQLPALLREAGATRSPLKDATAYDLGGWSEREISGPLSPLEAYASRTAFEAGEVVLARVDTAREAMLDDEASPLDEPRIDLAASCLGDVDAARTLPGGLTYNKVASPELLAIGSAAPGEIPRRQVICAVGGSADEAKAQAEALRRTLAPGSEDPVTDEPLSSSIATASIGTLASAGAYAARAELTLTAGASDSFVFDAFDRGSVLTYLGAPAPIP
jgi:hypothetical protein